MQQPHEAKLLMLDIAKAGEELGWTPRMNLEKTIEFTTDWYKRYQSEDVYKLCVEQINKYINEF